MKKLSIIHYLVLMSALLAIAGGLFGGSGSAHAGGLINTGYFGGIAIMGYDPVAYFTKGRAMKGRDRKSSPMNGWGRPGTLPMPSTGTSLPPTR